MAKWLLREGKKGRTGKISMKISENVAKNQRDQLEKKMERDMRDSRKKQTFFLKSLECLTSFSSLAGGLRRK
jgi:hypothetical protein